MHHFEAMVDSLAANGELAKAIQAMCVMHKSGLVVDQGTTRSIYKLLKDDPQAAEGAVVTLRTLKRELDIPIAVFNVVLEALVRHNPEHALEVYRRVRQIVPSGPDAVTFRHLFDHVQEPQAIVFLWTEMGFFKIGRAHV